MKNSVKPTYSIILMRDDCDVSAFRLHSLWIKLFILFLVILVAACAFGAYGAFYYKARYEAASAERRSLQRALGESKIKLESLSNEALVGRFGAGPAGGSQGHAVNSVLTPRAEAASAGIHSTIAPTQADLSLLLNQLGPTRAAGAESSAAIEELMEKHPIRISNLKTSFEGEDRIRIAYDLSNQQPGLTLSGGCTIALLTREGALVDITPSARGVLTFQIARFRKMDVLTRLPSGLKREEIVKIQVSAQANDLPPYYKSFPLTE
ncbi:MAG: hypothetical protein LBQ63_07840 [Deltaproteobacteria bacterium]|jgi:hypothetical protein|nr:hypothetical protein [Deltaproteobacteria bacterium]